MTAEFVIVGGDSVIATSLAGRLTARGCTVVATTRRLDSVDGGRFFFDLAAWDGKSLDWLPQSCSTVLLTAAMTSQQACAKDPDASRRVNCDQPVRLAEILAQRGVRLLFLSTNAVFDGRRPHRRSDEPTAPVSVYGQLKAEAERAILSFPDNAVLRLTKVLHHGLPLISRWREHLVAGESIEAFGDLYMAPVALADATSALEGMLRQDATGILHLSGRDDLSYWEFARRLARRLGVDEARVRTGTMAAACIDLAQAPRHTTLAMGEAEMALGWVAPEIDSVLASLVGDDGASARLRRP
jgi:dTDP-4-dehydrorhamnose reductase